MLRDQLNLGAMFRASLITLICISCLCSKPVAAQDNAATAVEKTFQQYAKDWNTGNLDGVFSFLATDVVQMPADGNVIVGKKLLEADWRKFMSEYNDEWTPTVTEVAVSGSLAYLRGHFIERRTPKAGGPSQTTTADAFWVMRREPSGEWKLVLETWFGKG